MNINTISGSSAGRRWSAVRDDLRDARQARAAHRALERELATYKTPSEVNDLLGSLRGQEGAEVEVIRHILSRNLQQQRPRRLAA
jgi:hypothetical protein